MRKYDIPLVTYTKVSVNTVTGLFNELTFVNKLWHGKHILWSTFLSLLKSLLTENFAKTRIENKPLKLHGKVHWDLSHVYTEMYYLNKQSFHCVFMSVSAFLHENAKRISACYQAQVICYSAANITRFSIDIFEKNFQANVFAFSVFIPGI